MEKIADRYFRFDDTLTASEGVVLTCRVDRIDGEDLDTNVKLNGEFTVAGSFRREFAEKLGALIEEYRI